MTHRGKDSVFNGLKRVKRTRIVIEDLVDRARRDLALVANFAQGLDLAGIVGMTVVGANHEIILAGVAEQIIEIVVGLASDVNAFVLENGVAQFLAAAGMAARQIVDCVRNPLRADFDNADAKFGKALRDAVIDQRMERPDHGKFEFTKAGLIEKKI